MMYESVNFSFPFAVKYLGEKKKKRKTFGFEKSYYFLQKATQQTYA